MPLSPWLALGAVLALIGAFVAGNSHGHWAEKQGWQAAIAEQKAQAAQLLTLRTQAVEAAELKAADLNSQLESTRHAAEIKAADSDAAVTAAVATYKLRQQARCGSGSPGAVREDNGTRGPENPASGGKKGLDDGIPEFGQRCSRGAAELAAYANECHSFALSLKP